MIVQIYLTLNRWRGVWKIPAELFFLYFLSFHSTLFYIMIIYMYIYIYDLQFEQNVQTYLFKYVIKSLMTPAYVKNKFGVDNLKLLKRSLSDSTPPFMSQSGMSPVKV